MYKRPDPGVKAWESRTETTLMEMQPFDFCSDAFLLGHFRPSSFSTTCPPNGLIVLLRQSGFERDGKECMAKLRRVVRIPKEGMVGVGAHHGG